MLPGIFDIVTTSGLDIGTMTTRPRSIGFIGLGLMGFPMAKTLVKKTDVDTHLYVYDVVQQNIDRAVQEGEGRIHACGSSKEVADKSDIILSMVPEGTHVKAVYLDPNTGVLQSRLGSKILLDCSTIDTETSLHVRDACLAQHPSARFYDAPVSGGVLGAEKGTLTFMLGSTSSNADYPLVHALLSLMGSNVFPCGGPSLGLTAKLCNNYCSGLIAIAVSESMNIGIANGMDPRVLANIFHTSTAQSRICDDWCPVPGLCPEAPASKGYRGGFRVELMKKDFGLAVQAAETAGVSLALGGEGLKVYEGACGDEGCKGLDSRVVYRYLGGEEEWREKGGFERDADMMRDETKRLIQLGKEADRKAKEGVDKGETES